VEALETQPAPLRLRKGRHVDMREAGLRAAAVPEAKRHGVPRDESARGTQQ